MEIAVHAKFSIPELLEKLKTIQDHISENTNDVWGAGGKNYLGLILMDVRDNS